MAATDRSFYMYTTVSPDTGEANENRSFYQYSLIGPYREWLAGALYAMTSVSANPVWAGRSLYGYTDVTQKVSEDTPVEIQLLDGTTWEIERILNPK